MTREEAIEVLKKIASYEDILEYLENHSVTVQDACYMAIKALEQQKEVEHQEILISLKDLAEFWDDFVCAHYFAEDEDRLSQDDLMDELGIAFQDRFPKEYNEYRRKVILGIKE